MAEKKKNPTQAQKAADNKKKNKKKNKKTENRKYIYRR